MNFCKVKVSREIYAKLMEFQMRDFKAGRNKTVDEIADQFLANEINRQENEILENLTKIELQPATIEITPSIEKKLKRQLTKFKKIPKAKKLKKKRHSKDSTNFTQ